MNLLFKLIIGNLILVLAFSCNSQKAEKNKEHASNHNQITKTLDAQLKEIMDIWPGVYNNDKQIASAKAKGEDIWEVGEEEKGEGGYLQIQSHYIKIDKSAIGDHVLYVEEYRDHLPEETYRQRIYTLSIDTAANQIKVKMWPFKDKKKYIGAWKNLTLLDSLTVDQISAFPAICDLHVSRIDNKYNMRMHEKDCAFGDKYFSYEVMLSKDMFSYRDKITQLSNDSLLTTAANFTFHDLNRIN